MADDALTSAGDRIRETAKWLTLSLAAIGGVLAAGSQLSSLGSLEVGSDRFRAAVAGAAAAGLGALVVLIAVTATATSRGVWLGTLTSSRPRGAKKVVGDTGLLAGFADVGALREEYTASMAARREAYKELAEYKGGDQSELSRLNQRAAQADANAVSNSQIALTLVGAASYAALSYRWRWSIVFIAIGGVLAGAGIGVFAWAANPPADAKASTANPAVLTAPEPGQLHLTPAGRSALATRLGPSCPTSDDLPVLVLGDTPAGPDVLTNSPDCNTTRLVLTSSWGTVTTP